MRNSLQQCDEDEARRYICEALLFWIRGRKYACEDNSLKIGRQHESQGQSQLNHAQDMLKIGEDARLHALSSHHANKMHAYLGIPETRICLAAIIQRHTKMVLYRAYVPWYDAGPRKSLHFACVI